jgi:NAD(P)H-nitrite reductase large subunit
MMEKKKDILEKGALIQRDGQTYAIVPHLTGGLCTPEALRKIADVAEKYNAAALKMTGAARLAIVGVKEEDLDNIWEELGMSPAAAVGLCVRSIKFCPGTTFCRMGKQDAVGLGSKLDELYHGFDVPSKMKIGVSGCPFCCAESWVKDLGFIGTEKGWKIVVGGSAASKPRVAEVLTDGLTTDEALSLTEKLMDFYRGQQKTKRLGALIDSVGIDELKKGVGL